MADQQIDELSLKIEVKQNNVAKDIDKISAAIDKLTSSLKGMKELSGVLDQLSKLKLPKNVSAATKKVAAGAPKLETKEVTDKVLKNKDNKVAIASSDALKQVSEQVGELHKMQTNIEEQKKTVADLGITVEQVRASYSKLSEQTKILNDGTKQTVQVYQQVQDGMKKTVTVVDGVVRSQNEAAINTQKHASSWGKLVKSIGRIAFYRAIRTALKEITQAAKEGLGNIRSVDKELDTSMNKIQQSGVALKNSFASLLAPLIKAFEPIFVRISDAIANYVNKLNEAQAKLKGESKYTKILTSDTEEYQKALKKVNGELLSFDTFTTLGSGDNTYTGTIIDEVKMSDEEAESFSNKIKDIQDTVTLLSEIVITIGDIITGIEKIKSALGFSYFGMLKSSFNEIKSILKIIDGIIKLITGDVNGAKKSFSDAAKTIKDSFGGLIETIFDPIGSIIGRVVKKNTGYKGPTGWASGLKWVFGKVFGFANGGVYETGDFFKANENGTTELIASTNTGGSVMNLDQWESISYSSFYRALADYNAAQNGQNVLPDINTLGRGIAASQGFINEANRRNPALKLR